MLKKKRREVVITIALPLDSRYIRLSALIRWPLTWVNSPKDPALHPNGHLINDKWQAILPAIVLKSVNGIVKKC